MIDLLREFFTDNPDIPKQLLRHAQLAYLPVLGATAVALPIGLYIGHRRRFEFIAVTTANLGRAIPSFAILSLALPISISIGTGLGFWPTFAALFFLSLPPILVNSYVGVKNVDADTIESARGMGLSGWGVLRTIELPLAAPLIVTGLKTAAVQSVATATLGSFVAAGGLGDYIRLGFRAGHPSLLIGGALLVALLALATEVGLSAVGRVVRPTTSSRGREVEPWLQPGQVPRPGGELGGL